MEYYHVHNTCYDYYFWCKTKRLHDTCIECNMLCTYWTHLYDFLFYIMFGHCLLLFLHCIFNFYNENHYLLNVYCFYRRPGPLGDSPVSATPQQPSGCYNIIHYPSAGTKHQQQPSGCWLHAWQLRLPVVPWLQVSQISLQF